MAEELVTELEQIDARVIEMSQAVLQDPSQRDQLAAERTELSVRFEELIQRLQQEAPETHQQMSRRISEITLDLDYVEQKTRFVSMRLGRAMERHGT